MERSLIILKPDVPQRGLMGPIITRLEQRGLKFIGMKMIQISSLLAQQHYSVHQGKSFFKALVDYITAGPVVVIAVQGNDVIKIVRSMVGSTRPNDSAPGTIRGDFGLEVGRNLIHASDSPENGETEVALFFKADELIAWSRATDPWIHE